jgi:tRNA nucleotidyltransferase (CCA-adding enzyme)
VAGLDEHPLAAVALAHALCEDDTRRTWIMRYVAQWRRVRPGVDGETLRTRGLPPGPAYRAILWELRAAWLDGAVRTAAEESAWLERRLAAERAHAAP